MKKTTQNNNSILHPFVTTTVSYLIRKFCMNIIIAPWTIAKISARLNNSNKTIVHAIPFVTCFGLFVCLHLAELFCSGCWALAWFFYLCFAASISYIRIHVRQEFNIDGNPLEDLLVCIIFYPNVAVQMEETLLGRRIYCNYRVDFIRRRSILKTCSFSLAN